MYMDKCSTLLCEHLSSLKCDVTLENDGSILQVKIKARLGLDLKTSSTAYSPVSQHIPLSLRDDGFGGIFYCRNGSDIEKRISSLEEVGLLSHNRPTVPLLDSLQRSCRLRTTTHSLLLLPAGQCISLICTALAVQLHCWLWALDRT